MIETLITFIIIFGIIVAIHEYGHLWWAKRSGILVREYAVGMGPKIFAHQEKMERSTRFGFYHLGAMFVWPAGVMIKLK